MYLMALSFQENVHIYSQTHIYVYIVKAMLQNRGIVKK